MNLQGILTVTEKFSLTFFAGFIALIVVPSLITLRVSVLVFLQ